MSTTKEPPTPKPPKPARTPRTPRKYPLRTRPKSRTIPSHSPKRRTHTAQYPPRYPLAIRGRVEIALFTCPREGCGTLIRYRARTQIAHRCPECSTTFYVGIRVMIRRRTGGRVGIPLDSILPKSQPRTHGMSDTSDVAAQNAQNPIKSLDSGVPDPYAAQRRTRNPHATTRRRDAIDAIPTELELDAHAEGSIETMPEVELERWEPGEPLHEVVEVEVTDGEDSFKPEL
jgi:hypothetical protein